MKSTGGGVGGHMTPTERHPHHLNQAYSYEGKNKDECKRYVIKKMDKETVIYSYLISHNSVGVAPPPHAHRRGGTLPEPLESPLMFCR
jgi:hypothetical protein